KHHIAPKAVFQELSSVPENIILLSIQEHFYAHYLLALAVPECAPFQIAFYMMANTYAAKIKANELPHFAEIYEKGRSTQLVCMKKLHADPTFAAACKERGRKLSEKLRLTPAFVTLRNASASKTFIRLNADPIFAKERNDRFRNLYENPILAEAHLQRLNKMNADQVFAAVRDARMKNLNADPVFAAAHIECLKKVNHIRWHVKRGIVSMTCSLCLVENN